MIGVYKITSPTGRVYIGSSVDLEYRIKCYENMWNPSQVRIYNSIKKYGWENHVWEILEETTEETLYERERYYQEKYDVLSRNGLNCEYVKTDSKPRKLSQESIEKMRSKLTGRKQSRDTIEKRRKSNSKPLSETGRQNIQKGIRERFQREKGDLLGADMEGNIVERYKGIWDIDTEKYNPHSLRNAMALNICYKKLYWSWEKE